MSNKDKARVEIYKSTNECAIDTIYDILDYVRKEDDLFRWHFILHMITAMALIMCDNAGPDETRNFLKKVSDTLPVPN